MNESYQIPSDHQGVARNNTTNPPGYDPTPEEAKAIKLADTLFNKAKNARKPYERKWLDYYRMFRGRQWKDKRPGYRHSEVINLIFRAIQSDVPILTDGRPKPEFIPTKPGDLEIAQILNDVLDSDWERGSWLFKLTEIIYDMHFYGAAFGQLGYDPDAGQGEGRITFDCEDILSCYPDPNARNVNERANYFVFAEPTGLDELKREYPDKAQFFKPDLIDLSRHDREQIQDQIKYKSPTDNRSILEGQTYDTEQKDEALKVILYIHDPEYSEEEKKELGEDGAERSVYIQKLKYPNGRKIVTVSGVLCEDGPLEYEDKKFPYLRMINYILPREFWGISEVEQLESPQKIFNKLVSFSLDVLTLMGNPVWVVDNTSGVDTDNLYNRPGLIIEKEAGTEVRREPGVELQPYVMQFIDRMKGWFDDVSGSSDSSRGIKPEGVTAASAIEALQEATQTRLRQKSRNIDAFTQEFGQMYASRVFQFYDTPRVIRVTGEDNVNKYFKFHIEKQPKCDEFGMPTCEMMNVARVRHYGVSIDGQHVLGEEKAYQIEGEFDVRISSGSALPFDKNRIESQSFNLFDRGIIDAEEVLKNIKYPNAEAVLKRQAEKAAQAAAQGPNGNPSSNGSSSTPKPTGPGPN